MRLISQDGTIDVPYEQVSVELIDCDIWCGYYPTLSQHLISKNFATYSNTDKALKAMEMLRNRNFWDKDVFKFPKDEEVEV